MSWLGKNKEKVPKKKNKYDYISEYQSKVKDLEKQEKEKYKLIEKSITEFILRWEDIKLYNKTLVIQEKDARIEICNFFNDEDKYIKVDFMCDEFRYNNIRFYIYPDSKAYNYCLDKFYELFYKEKEKSYQKTYNNLDEQFDKLCKIDKRLVALLRNDKLDKLGD